MQTSPGDHVMVRFTRDFQSCDGSVTYTKDSEHLCDSATADALVLAGVAVKIPAGADGVPAGGSKTPLPPDGRG